MKALPLLSRFDLVADAPGNIQRLRKLIVHLAVSGRLLDNLGDKTSPREILSNIASERQALIKAGKAKKQRVLPPIHESELPAGCLAVDRFERLENIAILEKGLTAIQRAKPGDYPLVTTGENKSTCDHYDFVGRAAVIPMVSSSGHGSASLKRLHYQEGKFAVGNILCAAFPISDELISARFIFEYLTAFKEELLVSKMIGTANVSLTLGKIGEVPVPIVPPIVQRRVDELMTVCDRLEQALEQREKVRGRLVTASLSNLNGTVNGESFHGHAYFYLNHLPRLTTRSDHIKQLRQTILNLAVRGKLVKMEEGFSAMQLLEAVKTERMRMKSTNADLAKTASEFETLERQQRNIETPNASISARCACHFITKGTTPAHEKLLPVGEVPFLKVYNIVDNKLDFDYKPTFISRTVHQNELRRSKVLPGDVLMNIVGPPLGKVALVTDQYPEWNINQAIAVFRPLSSFDSRFLMIVLSSLPTIAEVLKETRGVVGQDNLSLEQVRSLKIPLLPIVQQRRIVAKVDELMALCDRLEAQLTATQTETSHLLETVLYQALTETP